MCFCFCSAGINQLLYSHSQKLLHWRSIYIGRWDLFINTQWSLIADVSLRHCFSGFFVLCALWFQAKYNWLYRCVVLSMMGYFFTVLLSFMLWSSFLWFFPPLALFFLSLLISLFQQPLISHFSLNCIKKKIERQTNF